ncbi:MAG TPA: four helix bundle protein [Flavobacteriales bacterium]|nr:four helix bundle protein [Flavobacteriales bacterium]
MTQKEMKARTKKHCLQIIFYLRKLPKSDETVLIGKQLMRSSTSIAANYMAACRAKSAADFTHKIKIVEEEADETCFWMELLIELYGNSPEAESLLKESSELTAIFYGNRPNNQGKCRKQKLRYFTI